MHIVYVTTEYIDSNTKKIIDGGLANYLHKITTALSNLGHEITVIVTRCDVNKIINYKGIRVIFTNNEFKRKFYENIVWPFYPTKKRNKIKEHYLFNSTSKIIKKLNSKHKVDIIQYASYLATGKYPGKDIPYCIRISSYAKLMQRYYNYTNEKEIEDESIQFCNSKFIFGPSKYIASYIENDLNLNKEIKIIESPYSNCLEQDDSRVLDDLKLKIGDKHYLLFFGSIGRLKGCGVIADCIYDILKQYPDLYFVLIGKTILADYVKIIKNNANEFSNRVIRYESLPHSQLYPIIKNSYGVLMPSLTENFSNACVEAMRLKKIVIGTEDNFSQLITDRVNGFLSKVGDSESLKEKIFELMELSTEQKESMETKAYERTETLSPEKICNQLLEYYDYVIKHWRNKNE